MDNTLSSNLERIKNATNDLRELTQLTEEDPIEDIVAEVDIMSKKEDVSECFTTSFPNGTGNTTGWSKTLKKFPAINPPSSTTDWMFFFQDFPFPQIDLSKFTRQTVNNAAQMFLNSKLTSIDMSKFNLSNCTSIEFMFANSGWIKELDLSSCGISTSIQTTMRAFDGCWSLQTIDLRFLHTCPLSMSYRMFYGCSSLKNVDLSNFNISSTTPNMLEMFYNCTSLEKLDIRSFEFSKLTQGDSVSNMFYKVPVNCLIIVKNQTEKDWLVDKFPTMTNIKTISEYEGA